MTTASSFLEKQKAVEDMTMITRFGGTCQYQLSAQGKENRLFTAQSDKGLLSNGTEMTKPVYVGRRQVGTYNPKTKQFIKPVTRSKHYFRMVSGYAIDAEVFDRAEGLGCREIVIVEADTGQRLKSKLMAWKEHGKVGTWGHGRQRTLSEKYMTRSGFES